MSEADSHLDDTDVEDGPTKSLVVQLRYRKELLMGDSPNGAQPNPGINEKPMPVKPAIAVADPMPNYPSSGLPHHFSPPIHAQPFVNGAPPAELQGGNPEKQPEHLLYAQPQTVQL